MPTSEETFGPGDPDPLARDGADRQTTIGDAMLAVIETYACTDNWRKGKFYDPDQHPRQSDEGALARRMLVAIRNSVKRVKDRRDRINERAGIDGKKLVVGAA